MSRAGAEIFIALLRGFNIGGNRLPMRALLGLFEAAGARSVRGYLQSGNVVFAAAPSAGLRICTQVTKQLLAKHELKIPIVLRSEAELIAVERANPFLAPGASMPDDQAALYVLFLADEPTPAQRASLDPDRSPPDQFAALGKTVYLCLAKGAAKTKLTNAWFDSKLKTVTTFRNWRTLRELIALARAE